jgi:nitrous oxidase accessory protein
MKILVILQILLMFAADAALGWESGIRAGDLPIVISSALTGDTIVVSGGTCEANLVLTRRLVLLGVNRPLLRGTGHGSVLTLLADSCVVRGFTIEHSGKMLVDEDAGILIKSGGNLIEDNDLRDILFGIYLFNADRNTAVGNRIVGRRHLELGERGSGIHVWNSRANVFRRNVITDTRDGFYIQTANRTLIEDNTVNGVRYGLHYMYADSNIFLRNVFYDNVAGAAVMYSKDIVMRHNVFLKNRGFASFGILFQDCHGLSADSNVIADNVVGMFFEGSFGNSFHHNIIAQNDVALEMFQNSVDNTFSENNFVDNLSPLVLVGKKSGSQWTMGGRGNYWSTYDGYDIDGDGIGDIPMKIENVFQYLEGRNANVRLYLYSPASQALGLAAKAFPVMAISMEADRAPLIRPLALEGMPAVRLSADVRPSAGGSAAWALLPAGTVIGLGFLYHRLSGRKS